MLKFLTTFFSLFSLSDNFNTKKFELGVSTSAFQIESSYNRSQTIWDDFIKEKNLPDINNGPLHDLKYEEDFKIMKDLGIKEYRFSFSWARFLEEEGNNGSEQGHICRKSGKGNDEAQEDGGQGKFFLLFLCILFY